MRQAKPGGPAAVAIVLVAGLIGCDISRSGRAVDLADAADRFDARLDAPSPDAPPADAGEQDAAGDDAGDPCEVAPALVLYDFVRDGASTTPDSAAAAPDVDLGRVGGSSGVDFGPGGAVFAGGRLVAESGDDELGSALLATGSLTVVTWIETDDLRTGPARIVTLSSSPSSRAFTIGQDNGDLIVRLRTTVTNTNGDALTLDASAHYLRWPLFPTGASQRQIAVTFEGASHTERLYVDGVEVASLVHADSTGVLGTLYFQPTVEHLVLGDEYDYDRKAEERRWFGTMAATAIWDVALDPAQIACLHAARPPGPS